MLQLTNEGSLRQYFVGVRKRIDNPKTESTLDFFLDNLSKYIAFLQDIGLKLDYSSILHDLQNQIFDWNDRIVYQGEQLAKFLDRLTRERLKEGFRHAVGQWVYQSRIMRKAYEKKRGYPGDFELLELIYNNQEISEGLGCIFDRYFLNNPLAQGVRRRKDQLVKFLADRICNNNTKLKLLNLACGSCRDLVELADQNDRMLNQCVFTCVDFDKDALEFSKHALTRFAGLQVDFIAQDVLKVKEHLKNQIGTQDIMYSIGLVDYLPDRVFKKFLQDYAPLLRPGGIFIFAHKDQEVYRPVPPDWFCDWVFYRRTVSKVIEMSKEAAPWNFVDLIHNPGDPIIFVILRK